MGFRIINNKKNVLIGLAILIVVAILAIWLSNGFSRQASSPNYETVLPGDKTIEELGGWKLSSPPNNDPAFSYNDFIDDISISVSQQPMPESFEGDTANRVADLAKQNNATTEITVDGTIVYIGASAKGPQSVIFTKNSLLIFIKSQDKISNNSWSQYIQNLK